MKVYSTTADVPANARRISECSIERVMNSALKSALISGDETLHTDLLDVKDIVRGLWDEARNSIFMQQLVDKGDPLGLTLQAKAEKEHSK
jgi:hypothetical protein